MARSFLKAILAYNILIYHRISGNTSRDVDFSHPAESGHREKSRILLAIPGQSAYNKSAMVF
jgi:hypothetical protein